MACRSVATPNSRVYVRSSMCIRCAPSTSVRFPWLFRGSFFRFRFPFLFFRSHASASVTANIQRVERGSGETRT